MVIDHFRCPNWEETKERYIAWWNRDVADRPLVWITAPSFPGEPSPPLVGPDEATWLNLEFRFQQLEERMADTYYAGDAIPCLNTFLGPGSLALYLGSPAGGYADDTIWFEPCIQSIASDPLPTVDPNNRFWRFTLGLYSTAASLIRRGVPVPMTDLVDNLDILASMRGTQNLLFDMVETPNDVHRFLRAINQQYFQCFEQLYKLIACDDGSSWSWVFNLWGPGKVSKIQCDISAMISPTMFDEFVAPYIQEQAQWLDRSVYHLDGPSAACHLDTILSIPEIDAVQWTPGFGAAPTAAEVWWPMYRRIRKADKSLLLIDVGPGDIEKLTRVIGPEGFYFLAGADSPELADALVREARQAMTAPA